jgi:uncharacterized RDD family membrane protein YckC
MTGRRYGGFWRRSFALLIDEIILYFVSLILFLIGLLALGLKGGMMARVLASPDDLTHGMHISGLLYIAASLLAGMTYFTWFHGIAGRTPGKMLLGLRVIQASGDPMTPGVAFLRWVSYLISGLVFCLGFLWIAFDGRKQGWHDKIAATVVIRDRGKYDRDAERSFTESAACIPTTPTGVATGTPPSAGVEETFVPPPGERQEKPCTDDSLPRP